ncbi:hypothetical protein QVD17_38242 [Tagetes erecta]|uniref:Uncharacterized protein n=1 Tax=Tagetes erecta TaxID=13708 RepID=A0AAD8JW54_TARER|nr:hypothetical protein QVD17_38242 [Tagetes erecta]
MAEKEMHFLELQTRNSILLTIPDRIEPVLFIVYSKEEFDPGSKVLIRKIGVADVAPLFGDFTFNPIHRLRALYAQLKEASIYRPWRHLTDARRKKALPSCPDLMHVEKRPFILYAKELFGFTCYWLGYTFLPYVNQPRRVVISDFLYVGDEVIGLSSFAKEIKMGRIMQVEISVITYDISGFSLSFSFSMFLTFHLQKQECNLDPTSGLIRKGTRHGSRHRVQAKAHQRLNRSSEEELGEKLDLYLRCPEREEALQIMAEVSGAEQSKNETDQMIVLEGQEGKKGTFGHTTAEMKVSSLECRSLARDVRSSRFARSYEGGPRPGKGRVAEWKSTCLDGIWLRNGCARPGVPEPTGKGNPPIRDFNGFLPVVALVPAMNSKVPYSGCKAEEEGEGAQPHQQPTFPTRKELQMKEESVSLE